MSTIYILRSCRFKDEEEAWPTYTSIFQLDIIYVVIYCCLHSVQLFVYFCNLLWSLNHSTLSRVSLTTWYTLPGISRAKVVVKHQMGESSGGFSNTSLFMVSCGGIKSRLWSQLMLCGWSSPILLDHTVKEVFKGKLRINSQISTFHFNITSFKSSYFKF